MADYPDIPPKGERTTRDYARRLFNNVYNYTLLGACGTAALVTGDWWLLLVGAGLEALFMLYAPDNPAVRILVDKVLDKQALDQIASKREKILKTLARADQIRCQYAVGCDGGSSRVRVMIYRRGGAWQER